MCPGFLLLVLQVLLVLLVFFGGWSVFIRDYSHLGLDDPLLGETVLCFAGCLSLASTCRWQRHNSCAIVLRVLTTYRDFQKSL